MMSSYQPQHVSMPYMALNSMEGDALAFPLEARECPKKRGDRPGKAKAPARKKGLATDTVDHTGGGAVLVCTTCGFPITRESERMEVNGSHTHGFANPHGIYYDIGCFAFAPGCAYSSESSAEFAWFAGHRWRLAICRGCGSHMGWLFESQTGSFAGLILSALTLEQEEGSEGS